MVHIVTRKEEEIQTLRKFVENLGEKFDSDLVDYSCDEPCDVSYKKVQYQITVGDQDLIAKKGQDMKKYGRYLVIRSIKDSNDPKVIVEKALQKKAKKSSKLITLLIDCTTAADYPKQEREEIFKKYRLTHEDLRGLWESIYLVFRGQNIELFECDMKAEH